VHSIKTNDNEQYFWPARNFYSLLHSAFRLNMIYILEYHFQSLVTAFVIGMKICATHNRLHFWSRKHS
jgi:hypothetical protein